MAGTCSLPRPVAIDVMDVPLAEEEAKSVEEALEYYRKGAEAGVQVLGPKGFKEYAAHFWGVLETRPYMRARAGLAATLNALGEVDAAISNYRDMLRLNSNDNQGIRYELASCLMKSGDTMVWMVWRAGWP